MGGISGGDSSSVTPEISNGVKEIFSTAGAFAALKFDDTIFVWGDKTFGGDQIQLQSLGPRNVRSVVSTQGGFAALKFDGSVICWGAPRYGGHADNIFRNIVKLEKFSEFQFCATKENGALIIWPTSFDY